VEGPVAPAGTSAAGAEAPADSALHCPRCGSSNVRRSKAKTAGERLVRYLTPFHYYRCRKCGHRGAHLGRVPTAHAHHDLDPSRTPGRPLERRDLEESLERRKRVFWTVVLAVALGALAGKYVHSCQQRAETSAPAE
jgi:ribosomal protein L37AE/L43A